MARSGPRKPRVRRAHNEPRKRPRAVTAPEKTATSPAARHSAVELALAGLAHDIRTPLTGILAFAELLAAGDIGERERGWAMGIRDAAEHLAQLAAVVVDAVKAEARGLDLRRDVFSPRRFTESVGMALIARAQTIGLKADVLIDPDLPENVIGDPMRLRAALENLIDNAVKFTAKGAVRLAVRARPARGNRVTLAFEVTDSGIGLRESEIRKLFRPFSQASAEVARRYGGTGLGLTLVKRLARAMGGDLTVTSKLAEGSTFRLSVTVARVPNAAKTGTWRAARGRQTPIGKLKILCVEDNPYGRVVLATLLGELGHDVTFAASGEAALAAIAQDAFDVVLMDAVLSGIDGFETTRRIRALRGPAARVPIIGLSARVGSDDEAKAHAAGMNAYLAKPASAQALREVLLSVRS